jgi:hypothetical protein
MGQARHHDPQKHRVDVVLAHKQDMMDSGATTHLRSK